MAAPVQANENQQAVPQTDEKTLNFERLRKQLDQEKAEKAKLMERVTLLEKAQSQKVYTNSEDEESDEPYVDHKRLEKKFKRFEDDLEKKIEAKAEEKARSLLEMEKQQSYIKQNPDFQTVLTQDNIEKFANEHPAIAERMLRMPDGFDRQALLYEQIKALQASKQKAQTTSIQDTINQNRKSPYYQPSNVGTSPYAQTGDFSDAGKKNAWNKMQELKKNLRI